jgi:nicotinate-nucleotide adenylyltransferase
MRLGIYGGTFDPIHLGHLLLAECCREQLGLDAVWFLPAAIPPHKQEHELTPAQNRIDMLELAVCGNAAFSVCRYETDRGGVNYTTETLSCLREQNPAAEFFLLVGADMLHDLPHWREPARICEQALVVGVRRAGEPPPDFDIFQGIAAPERIEAMRQCAVEMPAIGLSASEIRRRVAARDGIRYRTPRAVEKYIEAHGLYRT